MHGTKNKGRRPFGVYQIASRTRRAEEMLQKYTHKKPLEKHQQERRQRHKKEHKTLRSYITMCGTDKT